jgi:AraC-like DNA-binding protein
MPSITPVYARIIARELSRQGLDESALFAGTGLDPAAIWRESEIQLQPFQQLLKNAGQMQADLAVGFLLGQHQTLAALGPLGVALGSAPSLRDGLRTLESYTRLQASYIRVEPRTGLHSMSIRLKFLGDMGDTLREHAEATLMVLQNYIESVSGHPLDDAEFNVSYPEPEHIAAYREHLHSPCRFEQEHISLELPKHWLDNRSPYYHAELWGQSLRQLAQRLKELGVDDVAVYSRHIRSLLRSYEPPLPVLADIADKLHMSARTLNRRLHQEDSSFREIRGQVLNDWAQQHLLESDVTIEAIAVTLGYQDTANFRRAFRSRSGISPGEYRKRGRQG